VGPGWVGVLAHANVAGLPDHEDLMLLMPVLPILLLTTIVVVNLAGRRGLLGDSTRNVDISMPLVIVAATLSVGAAGIHFAVIQAHLVDGFTSVLFLALAWFQVIWAMAYLVRSNDLLRTIGTAINASVIVVWALSRTTGLPFGATPWAPETVGIADLFATSFEVVLVGLLASALLPRLANHVSGYSLPIEKAYVLASFSVVTVAVLTGLALLGAPAS
jgi:hypothetical protein